MNRLVIVGAGGHGKVIADLALKLGYAEVCFLDDRAEEGWFHCPVVGKTADLPRLDDGATDFVIGIGSNALRKQIAERFRVSWVTLVHPSAQIALDATLGEGTVVMAGAVVNASAQVGAHCIVNTRSVVEHDNVLGDYVHISPGASLGGAVRVGALSHIGIGASVRNHVEICRGCTIGAGAVVVKPILISGTYIGVPARMMG